MSLLGVDVGVTGTKGVAFGDDGRELASAYREYGFEPTRDAGTELSAATLTAALRQVVAEVAAKTRADPVRVICLSSMADAFVPVDAAHRPLTNVLVGMDARSAGAFESLTRRLSLREWYGWTGVMPSSGLGIPYLMWFRQAYPDVAREARRYLYVGEFLAAQLGVPPANGYTHAARTAGFDVVGKRWVEPVFAAAGVSPEDVFSTPQPEGSPLGEVPAAVAEELGLIPGVQLVLGGADQAMTALGGGLLGPGMATNSIGTVDCLHVVSPRPVVTDAFFNAHFSWSPHVAGEGYVTYLYMYTGASLLKWYRDQLGAPEREAAAHTGQNVYDLITASFPDSPTGLLVLPHFLGSGTPTLDPFSRGALVGLTLNTTRETIGRALLEGVAFENRLNLEYLDRAGERTRMVRALGGGARSPRWLQTKADVLGIPVERPRHLEGGCVGAAVLAGVGSGQFRSVHEALERLVAIAEWFDPDPVRHGRYSRLFEAYRQLYAVLRPIHHTLASVGM